MQHQRFDEARQWFHYIFDPTSTDGRGPERFWKVRPFYEAQRDGAVASLDVLLSGEDRTYEKQVETWEADPFQPHAIARLRITAYMQTTVMRYLDCLIQQGDVLFGRGTREDVNEANGLYQLAAEILGDRPTVLPAQETATATPNALLGRFRLILEGLFDANPLSALASLLSPMQPGPSRSRATLGMGRSAALVNIGAPSAPPRGAAVSAQGGVSNTDTLLLFCLPYNDVLYGYWDTVADRLFKIRNCMNLEGQVRPLALYAPRIDPALLARASAAGLSIETILGTLGAPASHYRFSVLLQKALDLCADARSFGASLLAALEKKDAEALAALRSTQEAALLASIRTSKTRSVDEAAAALAALVRSRESTQLRATYYAGLERISAGEQTSLDKQDSGRKWQMASEVSESLASTLHVIPYTYTGVGGMPPAPQTQVAFGGPQLGAAAEAVAAGLRGRAAAVAYEASRAAVTASYARRVREWKFQADLAQKDLQQLDKQIAAAQVRTEIAQADLDSHLEQTAQAGQVEEFLELKFTNQELYGWMTSKLSSVYFQTYQMAYQLAVQAEAGFRQELGPSEQSLTFVRPTNWDSLEKGLTAGELLHQQLRQMEVAYLNANRRELEITKHVSLFQLDPAALLALRQTGSCEFHVPEVLFAMDFASHYYRRLKAVRVTVPCVVGPYSSVSATLTLTSSWTRRNTDVSDASQPAFDAVAVPQSAIATSSGSQDGGMFELAFNDPRYLPFEGAGAVSSWRLDLPRTLHPFDYATIADVVLHLSYTARDGGEAFGAQVGEGVLSALNDLKSLLAERATLRRLFSVRQEFPGAWNQIVNADPGPGGSCVLQLTKRHFPSFLDYVWRGALDDGLAPSPITLSVTGLTAWLSPKGPLPSDADRILLNGQAGADAGLGIPAFNLLDAPGTLSTREFSTGTSVELSVTVDGTLRRRELERPVSPDGLRGARVDGGPQAITPQAPSPAPSSRHPACGLTVSRRETETKYRRRRSAAGIVQRSLNRRRSPGCRARSSEAVGRVRRTHPRSVSSPPASTRTSGTPDRPSATSVPRSSETTARHPHQSASTRTGSSSRSRPGPSHGLAGAGELGFGETSVSSTHSSTRPSTASAPASTRRSSVSESSEARPAQNTYSYV